MRRSRAEETKILRHVEQGPQVDKDIPFSNPHYDEIAKDALNFIKTTYYAESRQDAANVGLWELR